MSLASPASPASPASAVSSVSATPPGVAPAAPGSFDVAYCAAVLMAARRGEGPRVLDFPMAARPRTMRDAYAVQDAVAHASGVVAGWKVGAASPEGVPVRAPLMADTVHVAAQEPRQQSGLPLRLPAQRFTWMGVEAEWAYELAADLPARAVPYTRDEVLAAVASVRAVIEVCDSRFAAWGVQGEPSRMADQGCHGALVVGAQPVDARSVRAQDQGVRLSVNGMVAVEHAGWSNPAGDPLRLLLWLANEGAHSLGGLRAGQWVTTGSCTGSVMVAPGAVVTAEFTGIGRVDVHLA